MIEKSLEYFKNRLSKTLSDKRREAYQDAVEALEKQLPKKATVMDCMFRDINFRCPACKSEYICEKEYEHFYCPYCGQRLDWSE